MNDMKKCVTADGERKYGLWAIKNKNTAVRKCKCCGIDFELPITDSITYQINKQNEAIRLLKGFLMLSVDDPNLMGYVNVVLEDVVDYIDDDMKILLDRKLAEICTSAFVSDEISSIIQTFRISIMNNDNDLFVDTMEAFNVYNSGNLTNFLSTDSGRSR